MRLALCASMLMLCGCTGGTPSSDGRTATWSVRGAQTADVSHDGDSNFVNCTLTSSLVLDMTAAEFPGGDPAMTARVLNYSGPGTYNFEYHPGEPDGTADTRLLGGFQYWLLSDTSSVDFREVRSSCSIVVTEPRGGRIHAEISCADLVAEIGSTDYDDRDAAGFRPHVDLMAVFDCDI